MKYLIAFFLLVGCSPSSQDRQSIPISEIFYSEDAVFNAYIKSLVKEQILENQKNIEKTSKECKAYSECLGQEVKILQSEDGWYGCYIVKGKKKVHVLECE